MKVSACRWNNSQRTTSWMIDDSSLTRSWWNVMQRTATTHEKRFDLQAKAISARQIWIRTLVKFLLAIIPLTSVQWHRDNSVQRLSTIIANLVVKKTHSMYSINEDETYWSWTQWCSDVCENNDTTSFLVPRIDSTRYGYPVIISNYQYRRIYNKHADLCLVLRRFLFFYWGL